MDIKETIARLINLPRDFSSLPDASPYSLLRDSGYFAIHEKVTEAAIRELLCSHPECVDDWIGFSEDKRVSAGWFFQRNANGYQVGYFPKSARNPTVEYSDRIAACAAFIKREAEEIRKHQAER